jgi:hypothetical protein
MCESPGKIHSLYNEKKISDFPSPARMSPTKVSLPDIIQIFPARERWVSASGDIPAGDRKIANLFYSEHTTG